MDRLRELLSRHPKGLSLYDLADALAVTPRSMRRYLSEFARVAEVESVPTRGGGQHLWRLAASEVPRKVELRRTQAYALLASRRLFETLKGSALYDEIGLAIERLLAVAQRPGRGPNAMLADARLEDRFLYLPYAPKNYADRTEQIDDLFQAVADLRPLTVTYRSTAKGAKEDRFTIHPYAIVVHRDSIYCVGLHCDKSEVRTFLLDRMRETEASPSERFELPEGFSIDEYFQGEFGIWKSAARHKVVVDFDAQGAEYVRMRRVHASQKLASLPGGGVRLTMTLGDLKTVTSWILEWGARARVVEPPELVARVEQELGEALALYGKKAQRAR